MSVITKINQNVANLTVGGPNTPGQVTIFGGKFKMMDAQSVAASSIVLDGVNKTLALGLNDEIKLDGVNKNITLGVDSSIVLDGVNKSVSAGLAKKVKLDGVTGQLQIFSGSSNYGHIECDNSLNMLYVSKDSHFFFTDTVIAGDTYIGKLFRQDGVVFGMELRGGSRIQWQSGRTLMDASSELQIDGDLRVTGRIYPSQDNVANVELGSSAKRWKTLYSKNLNTGDIVFTDRYCPICEVEFGEGDCLVNFVYRKDVSEPETPTIYTVPAHFECVKKYKKAEHQKMKDFVASKSDELEIASKKLEKKFDKDFADKLKKAKEKEKVIIPE